MISYDDEHVLRVYRMPERRTPQMRAPSFGVKCDLLSTIGGEGSALGQLSFPKRVCFIGNTDKLLVCDHGNDRVQEMDVCGTGHRAFQVCCRHMGVLIRCTLFRIRLCRASGCCHADDRVRSFSEHTHTHTHTHVHTHTHTHTHTPHSRAHTLTRVHIHLYALA